MQLLAKYVNCLFSPTANSLLHTRPSLYYISYIP